MKKIIPIVENTRHKDLPGIEFFQAERLIGDWCHIYRLRYRVDSLISEHELRLDVHHMVFRDYPPEASITPALEKAMGEMAEKISLEIMNAPKKNITEELFRLLNEIPGFGHLSMDRQGEIVLEIIKICK